MCFTGFRTLGIKASAAHRKTKVLFGCWYQIEGGSLSDGGAGRGSPGAVVCRWLLGSLSFGCKAASGFVVAGLWVGFRALSALFRQVDSGGQVLDLSSF